MSEFILEINGKQYSSFTKASFRRQMLAMAADFSFTATVTSDSIKTILNDIKVQDIAKVYIDTNLVLTGSIEKMIISSDTDSHVIRVAGRDRLGNVVDSTMKRKNYDVQNFITLVKNVLSDNGFSYISVINQTNSLLTLPKTDGEAFSDISSQSIFSFLNDYAKKIGVLLYSNGDGNLVIARESSSIAAAQLIRRIGDDNNNVLSSEVDVDISKRYASIKIDSQMNDSFFSSNANKQDVTATDSEITGKRFLILQQEIPSATVSLIDEAAWHIALRKAKGSSYKCRVQDYYSLRDKGSLWQPNTLVSVDDQICQVNGMFLIDYVAFHKTINDGSITELGLVNRGSYSISKTALFGDDFGKNLIRTKPLFG